MDPKSANRMEKNYKRFYALLKKNPEADKDALVSSFTDGRSTHLRDMSAVEFNALCDALEHGSGHGYSRAGMQDLKAARSSALKELSRIGIKTVDNWSGIDQFCLSPRIAGKRFAALDVVELKKLANRLRMIRQHGGLKSAGNQAGQVVLPDYISALLNRNQIVS